MCMQASLVLHADPLFRTYKLAASVAFPGNCGLVLHLHFGATDVPALKGKTHVIHKYIPTIAHSTGPEWRETVYDEDKDVIEVPQDDGGRHKLWVAHTVKDRQWMYSTRIGAAFDLGRLTNWVADFVDYNVSDR